MTVASFFSGCGGLDLGFEQAGFDVVWANEIDTRIHQTYQYNHPKTILCKRDIRDIHYDEIPDCDGFIGGPPCQPWSLGGLMLGIKDERGKLFIRYLNLIIDKKPKFFLIENVPGLLSNSHIDIFNLFLKKLDAGGYNVYYSLLNALNFKIPQDRLRVFIVGIRKDIKTRFLFPNPVSLTPITLRNAISDINIKPKEYLESEVNQHYDYWLNHDVYTGGWDSKFMARNRVRSWDEPSFTIQALAKNCPIHPQAPKMKYVSSNKRIFQPGAEHLYRRLSIRECARIQSFPDSFLFIYKKVIDGYLMVGNAVPPRLAKYIALELKKALRNDAVS